MYTSQSNVTLAQEGPLGEAGVTNEPLSPFTPFNKTGPETDTELDKFAGSDEAILANDTAISNPNNTVLDSTAVNQR
jgi:hypothetical protein